MSTFRAAADALAGTLQLAVFAALALAPLAAAVVVGVGPPTYTATVTDVTDGTADADGDVVAYDALEADSRAVVDDLLAAEGDRLQRTTADPPAVLEPGERVVQREGYAVRVDVERSTPRRPPVLLLGLLGSTLTTLLGAAIAERTLV